MTFAAFMNLAHKHDFELFQKSTVGNKAVVMMVSKIAAVKCG